MRKNRCRTARRMALMQPEEVKMKKEMEKEAVETRSKKKEERSMVVEKEVHREVIVAIQRMQRKRRMMRRRRLRRSKMIRRWWTRICFVKHASRQFLSTRLPVLCADVKFITRSATPCSSLGAVFMRDLLVKLTFCVLGVMGRN